MPQVIRLTYSPARSENKVYLSSQNGCQENFAQIFQREIMQNPTHDFVLANAENSDMSINSEFFPVSSSGIEDAISQGEYPEITLSQTSVELKSSKIVTKQESPAKQNQLYQQQILFMPLLQFSIPKTTTTQDIIPLGTSEGAPNKFPKSPLPPFTKGGEPFFKGGSECVSCRLSSSLRSRPALDRSEAVNFANRITENSKFIQQSERSLMGNASIVPNGPTSGNFAFQFNQAESPQIAAYSNRNIIPQHFRQQMEYIVSKLYRVISQALHEAGIAPEEFHNSVSLELFFHDTEKDINIGGKTKSSVAFCGKTKSSVAFCIAGINNEKTRQLFFSAAPILHNQLEKIKSVGDYKSPAFPPSIGGQGGKIAESKDTRGSLTQPRRQPDIVSEKDGLIFPVRPQFEASRFTQQAGQNGPSNLSDISPSDVITQIEHEIQINSKVGLEELRVQLKPEHLGSVILKVSMMKGVLSVDISTESDAVKNIIESHLQDLRQTLSQQGIEVGQFNVLCNTSGFGSQRGMSYSYTPNSTGNKRNPNLLKEVRYRHSGKNEALEQEGWLANQAMIDLWI